MTPAILRAATAAIFIGSSAAASEPALLTGPEIAETVSGSTIEGSMEASGRYSEFYADDGTIKGQDYTGSWTVEGDLMCFKYGEDPADCWSVGRLGTDIQWIKDGQVLGHGTLVEGNPNEY